MRSSLKLAVAVFGLVVASVVAEAKTTIKFALSVPDTPLATVQGLKAFKAYVEGR